MKCRVLLLRPNITNPFSIFDCLKKESFPELIELTSCDVFFKLEPPHGTSAVLFGFRPLLLPSAEEVNRAGKKGGRDPPVGLLERSVHERQ